MAAHSQTLPAATPVSRMDDPAWSERHRDKLREIAEACPQLIFLGDSITQDWELSGPPDWRDFQPVWDRFYGGRHAVNLGFGGDTTQNLLWRIRNGEVDGISPKAAVLLIGANDLIVAKRPAEAVVAGIVAIVDALRQRLPNTRILLIGILPSGWPAWSDGTVNRINDTLAARYRNDGSVAYLDLTALFLRDGGVDPNLFWDLKRKPRHPPLHPTAQAQAMMAKAMEPLLAPMLGQTPRD